MLPDEIVEQLLCFYALRRLWIAVDGLYSLAD